MDQSCLPFTQLIDRFLLSQLKNITQPSFDTPSIGKVRRSLKAFLELFTFQTRNHIDQFTDANSHLNYRH